MKEIICPECGGSLKFSQEVLEIYFIDWQNTNENGNVETKGLYDTLVDSSSPLLICTNCQKEYPTSFIRS